MALHMEEIRARMLSQDQFVVGGKVKALEEAAKLVRSGSTITFTGIAQVQVPDAMLGALEIRFLTEGEPKDLTLAYPLMSGAGAYNGVEHLAHEGMVRRIIGCNFYTDLYPEVARLIGENKVEAYMLPLGSYLHLFREIAKGGKGHLTQVALGTFADPRLGGGKLNPCTKEDLVEVQNFRGEEYLYYKAFPIDVAIIRGTTADEDGNISLEDEPLTTTSLLYAMAAKASRGIVIAQVRRVVKAGSIIPSHLVKIPGIFVDAIVVDEHQKQLETFDRFDPRVCGMLRMPLPPQPPLIFDEDTVVCRRAMLEMKRGWVINFGARLPLQGTPLYMLQENIQDLVHISIEHGALGGICLGSHVHYNPTSFMDSERLFDYYLGGGYDACFLGGGEVDAQGNVNVGLLDKNLLGAGGSIDICHSVPRVYFMTKFTREGLQIKFGDGKLRIISEGRKKKFVKKLQQLTINASERLKRGQKVRYITERAVLRLEPRGLVLEEVAPGIDVRKDVLGQAEFEIFVDPNLREMDKRIFLDKPLNLREEFLRQ